MEDRLLSLRGQDETVQRAELVRAWRELDRRERYVWNKLITGSFRVGASARLVVRALAETSGLDEGTVAHRLMGAWEPSPEYFERLVAPDTRDADVSRPYPFYLASPLEQPLDSLGDPADWIAEWKWDGIRAQLVRRAGRTFLWSRGEELLSGRFPEVEEAGALLPEGTVLDGELLPWADGAPLPFAQLQRRIGRKVLGRKILSEVPVVLVAYDLLEEHAADLRDRPFAERRARLSALLGERPVAEICRVLLEQVVGPGRHRRLAQDLAAEDLPADPALRACERQRRPVGPGQQLPVEHGPLRQERAAPPPPRGTGR